MSIALILCDLDILRLLLAWNLEPGQITACSKELTFKCRCIRNTVEH